MRKALAIGGLAGLAFGAAAGYAFALVVSVAFHMEQSRPFSPWLTLYVVWGGCATSATVAGMVIAYLTSRRSGRPPQREPAAEPAAAADRMTG